MRLPATACRHPKGPPEFPPTGLRLPRYLPSNHATKTRSSQTKLQLTWASWDTGVRSNNLETRQVRSIARKGEGNPPRSQGDSRATRQPQHPVRQRPELPRPVRPPVAVVSRIVTSSPAMTGVEVCRPADFKFLADVRACVARSVRSDDTAAHSRNNVDPRYPTGGSCAACHPSRDEHRLDGTAIYQLIHFK